MQHSQTTDNNCKIAFSLQCSQLSAYNDCMAGRKSYVPGRSLQSVLIFSCWFDFICYVTFRVYISKNAAYTVQFNYNDWTSYMSDYFSWHIQPEGLLCDVKCEW